MTNKSKSFINEWVKIENIPEEWKDGRALLLLRDIEFCKKQYCYPTCLGHWETHEKYGASWIGITRKTVASDLVTHAMIPPAGPDGEIFDWHYYTSVFN